MVVTRYAVIVPVSLFVILSLLVPFGGVVAADADGGETDSTSDQYLEPHTTVESTVDADDEPLDTDGATENATDAPRETAEDVASEPIGQTEALVGDADGSLPANGSDDAERTGSPTDLAATLERLSWEVDDVEITYSSNEPEAVTIVVDGDQLDLQHQPDPDVVDELARILEAAATEPDIGIRVTDTESLHGGLDGDIGAANSTNDTENAAETDDEGDDRAAAALGLPDSDRPLQYVPPLTAGLFVLLKPLSGLVSGLLAFLSEWAGRLSAVLRYSSRDGDDPLEHETRARIDDLVTTTPGISLTDLADRMDTPLSTIRYHVKTLEREQYLTSQKHQGNRRLYPIGAENEALAAAMDNESTATIIESLYEQGQATVGEIVDDVGTTYSTVSHHLSRLADAGVVEKEKDGRCTVSKLDPSVRTALQRDNEPHHTPPARQPSSAD